MPAFMDWAVTDTDTVLIGVLELALRRYVNSTAFTEQREFPPVSVTNTFTYPIEVLSFEEMVGPGIFPGGGGGEEGEGDGLVAGEEGDKLGDGDDRFTTSYLLIRFHAVCFLDFVNYLTSCSTNTGI